MGIGALERTAWAWWERVDRRGRRVVFCFDDRVCLTSGRLLKGCLVGGRKKVESNEQVNRRRTSFDWRIAS